MKKNTSPILALVSAVNRTHSTSLDRDVIDTVRSDDDKGLQETVAELE